MNAKEYVKDKLPGAYVFSPCARRWVVKVNGVEYAERAHSKRSAWARAKDKLQSRGSAAVRDRSSAASSSGNYWWMHESGDDDGSEENSSDKQ